VHVNGAWYRTEEKCLHCAVECLHCAVRSSDVVYHVKSCLAFLLHASAEGVIGMPLGCTTMPQTHVCAETIGHPSCMPTAILIYKSESLAHCMTARLAVGKACSHDSMSLL